MLWDDVFHMGTTWPALLKEGPRLDVKSRWKEGWVIRVSQLLRGPWPGTHSCCHGGCDAREQGGSSALGRGVPCTITALPWQDLAVDCGRGNAFSCSLLLFRLKLPPKAGDMEWEESGAHPTLSSAGCCLPPCAGSKLQEGLQSHFQGAEMV